MTEESHRKTCKRCHKNYPNFYRLPNRVQDKTGITQNDQLCLECVDGIALENNYTLLWEADIEFYPTQKVKKYWIKSCMFFLSVFIFCGLIGFGIYITGSAWPLLALIFLETIKN